MRDKAKQREVGDVISRAERRCCDKREEQKGKTKSRKPISAPSGYGVRRLTLGILALTITKTECTVDLDLLAAAATGGRANGSLQAQTSHGVLVSLEGFFDSAGDFGDLVVLHPDLPGLGGDCLAVVVALVLQQGYSLIQRSELAAQRFVLFLQAAHSLGIGINVV